MSTDVDKFSGVRVELSFSHASKEYCVTLTHVETGCWAQSRDAMCYEYAQTAAGYKLRDQLQAYYAKQNAEAKAIDESVVIHVLWVGDHGTILNQQNAEEVLNALGDNPCKSLKACVKKYVEVKSD